MASWREAGRRFPRSDALRLLAGGFKFWLSGTVVENEILHETAGLNVRQHRFISALVSAVMTRGPVVMSPYSAVFEIE